MIFRLRFGVLVMAAMVARQIKEKESKQDYKVKTRHSSYSEAVTMYTLKYRSSNIKNCSIKLVRQADLSC